MSPDDERGRRAPVADSDPTPPLDGAPMTARSTTTKKKKKPAKKQSGARSIIEWVLVIGGALLLALVIRTFLIAAFYIPSGSMLDTLEKNDRVLVNKLSYKLHDVRRGDVIVFERPPNELDTSINDLIKRVIGLPGETVEVRDCRVIVDGRFVEEPYLSRPWTRTCTFGPITVPEGQVFVMGDNRDDSEDGRVFGPIDEDLIVGRAFVLIWPLNHLAWL
jgi:signal peptidase I